MVLGFWVSIITLADYPGTISDLVVTDSPLVFSFESHLQVPYRVAEALSILPNFASGLGFLYASTNLTHALSLSGLLPKELKRSYGEARQPLHALAAVILLQLVIVVIGHQGWSRPDVPPAPFFDITMFGACLSYIGIFASYITFQYRFETMERGFKSPFGVVGAAVGIIIFAMLFLILIFVHNEPPNYGSFFAYVALVLLYYYFVAKRRQFFSHEEQKKFMRAYILNANKRKKIAKKSNLLVHDMHAVLAKLYCGLYQASMADSKFNKTTTSSANSNSNTNSATDKLKLKKKVAPSDMEIRMISAAATASSTWQPLAPINGTLDLNEISPDGPAMTVLIPESTKLPSGNPDVVVSSKVTWSGKALNVEESKRFFEIINAMDEQEPVDFFKHMEEVLPEHFQVEQGVELPVKSFHKAGRKLNNSSVVPWDDIEAQNAGIIQSTNDQETVVESRLPRTSDTAEKVEVDQKQTASRSASVATVKRT